MASRILGRMQLSHFIEENLETILVEWEAFARTLVPPSQTLSVQQLRDHAQEILLAIAEDMDTVQSEVQREAKSKDAAPSTETTSSSEHGALRQQVGFDLRQLGAEYRALRATVLRLWMAHVEVVDAKVLEEVLRFNEAIDQGLAEAMSAYSDNVGNSRDTFLAVLGHDLRTPLSALKACLHLLAKTRTASDEKTLRIANRSVSAISEMITDLLEYTRTRLGRGIEINLKAGDFAAVCREVFDEVCAAHPARALSAEIPDDVCFSFDAARLRQVLTNLLANAVQYGDPAFPIVLAVRNAKRQVVAVVTNQGTPISPDSMLVIFNPLVQIAASAAEPHERPTTSLGLGLFIAREIVEGHGGSIKVTSSEAEGTAFTVYLPRDPANEIATHSDK